MKGLKRILSLLLALAFSICILPEITWAEAAETAYRILTEPDFRGGFQTETYEDVAAVWEYVYYDTATGQTNMSKTGEWKPMCLMRADESGLHRVSEYYKTVSGLSETGHAAAQNFDGKWGIIDSKGNVVFDFIYDKVSIPNDEGYSNIYMNDKDCTEVVLDIPNHRETTHDDYPDKLVSYSSMYSDGVEMVDRHLQEMYEAVTPTVNGYAIAEQGAQSTGLTRMVVDSNGKVTISDEGKPYTIGNSHSSLSEPVSREGLIHIITRESPVREGFMDVNGNIKVPLEYQNARVFDNGYAVARGDQGTYYDQYLLNTKGETVIPPEYGTLSNASNTGYVWAAHSIWENGNRIPLITAVLKVPAAATPLNRDSSKEDIRSESGDEHIYDTTDLDEDIVLPIWRLEEIIDVDCTVKSIDTLLEEVPLEELQTPTGTDLATLYAETAIMRAACKDVDGSDLLINASLLKIVESVAVEAQGRLAEKLESVGIPPAREISKTVTLTTDETSLDIRIDPDVLGTQVDKIRVETPTYALTFKLADLQDDLTGVLQFQAEDTGSGYAPSRTTKKAGTKTVIKIDLPKPKMSNPVTVSLPKQTGETVHQAVVRADGQATASKYNPATDLMDGKVNSLGSYTVKSNEKDFSDIANKSQEMQKAIRYLASKGIINGTTETQFSPDGSINRAEIATLIVKALGKLDSSAAANFTDVSRGSWFYAAAASSQKQGYIQGYEDRTFRGSTAISKVQIISVSSRVLQKEMRYKVPSSSASVLTKYSDTVDAWAQSDVALATKENLVLYRKDGTFSGRSNMTRGNAAIIIYRLFQRLW